MFWLKSSYQKLFQMLFFLQVDVQQQRTVGIQSTKIPLPFYFLQQRLTEPRVHFITYCIFKPWSLQPPSTTSFLLFSSLTGAMEGWTLRMSLIVEINWENSNHSPHVSEVFPQPVSQQLQYKAAVEAQIIVLVALKGKKKKLLRQPRLHEHFKVTWRCLLLCGQVKDKRRSPPSNRSPSAPQRNPHHSGSTDEQESPERVVRHTHTHCNTQKPSCMNSTQLEQQNSDTQGKLKSKLNQPGWIKVNLFGPVSKL